ncbi:hypothetical protein [Arthrobacter cryoconiti]|uniref:Uncharacterized protein n=1 Tax=Arthrobacter cryoconiti TaxID=748907 RepID=A0ABV8R4J6_9MICC|nr:hypothetical protein [Arthrobacter cryoconiti]MCC9066897.1 hypothetical protein [Arthrobacter cryoconiti]
MNPDNPSVGGWFEGLLSSETFFIIFFAVIAVFIVVVIVFVIVQLIRGRGRRRYVMMEIDDDGTMRPANMRGPGSGHNAGLDAHNAAHQQAMRQAQNQQQFPPGM